MITKLEIIINHLKELLLNSLLLIIFLLGSIFQNDLEKKMSIILDSLDKDSSVSG
jgi:hypothetical protein